MTSVAVGGTTSRRLARPLLPARDEGIDALAMIALTVIGLVGFRDAYGGHDYLLVGAAGAILGIALSHIGDRTKLPVLLVAALSSLAFLLLAGLVPQATKGAIPSPQGIRAVLTVSVAGWKQLLTTARPVGSSAHLLVLPYLLGVTSGVTGHCLARRTSRPMLPAAVPALIVALSILFGATHATAAVLQGAAFTAIALGWAALRQQRGGHQVTVVGRQHPWQRVGAASAVLAVAVAGAMVIGPRLPGAHAHQRVVLRVVPPLRLIAYPSPLASFRDYTKDAAPSVSLYNRLLLRTSGLPAGTRVRIAAMDYYDGLVWAAANSAAGTSTYLGFQRIGATIPGASMVADHAVTITIAAAYQLPWLPGLARPSAFSFTGAAGEATQAALRFNVATSTGFVANGLPPGLRYTVNAPRAVQPTLAQFAGASPYGAPGGMADIPPVIQSFASAHATGASSPMRQLLALAVYLREHGEYSDGGAGQGEIRAGHSSGRLTEFLQSPQIIGDDEQYAATMALLANAVGVPARVVLDGAVEQGGAVYGRDVRADIELRLAQYGWVTFPATMFTGARKAVPLPQHTPPPAPAKVVPPPAADSEPLTAGDQGNAVSRKAPPEPGSSVLHLPGMLVALVEDIGLPVLALAAIGLALAGAKSLRRRRRRARGPAAARASGAWRDLLDFCRDLGVVLAPDGTRREQATEAEQRALPGFSAVADAADAAVFGPGDPDEATIARIWGLADTARDGAAATLGAWLRLWIAVNPASLWAGQPVSTGRVATGTAFTGTAFTGTVARGNRGYR